MDRQLTLSKRRVFAGLLTAAGVAYGALLVATYVQTTAPSAVGPQLGDLHRLLYLAHKPVSPMERRLEAADTPLGTGPLIRGESRDEKSMRFAFAGQSDEAKLLTATELVEREGERQALLDWIRSGGSQKAYEQDDYTLVTAASVSTITPKFLVREINAGRPFDSAHVRIRSLINERCVTCHIQDDGDDTAHLIPFDNYDSIARYLVPDNQGNEGRPWLVTALVSLFPLAMLVCPAFACTSHSRVIRQRLVTLTILAMVFLSASWLAGAALAPVLFLTALFAVICIELQLLASVAELLGK